MITNSLTLSSDLRLTVSEAGDPAAPAVLVLHGGGGPFTVAPILEHLAPHAQVLMPTHPGWNGTPRPEWLADVPALADTYLQVLADRDLHDVVVIGSSMGGWIGSEMAARDTEGRIGRLIIIDGVGIEVPEAPMVDFFSLDARGIAEHSWHDPERFFVDPSTLPPERVAAQRANMVTMAAYTSQGMIDPSLRGRLARVVVPTLVLWGDSDRVVTPEYGRAFAAAFPDGRFQVLSEAGHLPQLEQPVATFAAIDGFLATLKA